MDLEEDLGGGEAVYLKSLSPFFFGFWFWNELFFFTFFLPPSFLLSLCLFSSSNLATLKKIFLLKRVVYPFPLKQKQGRDRSPWMYLTGIKKAINKSAYAKPLFFIDLS
jgi:hypothetical protein